MRTAWAVALETAYEDMTFMAICLLDGSASLYVSEGGSIIGAGEHEHVAGFASAIAQGAGLFFTAYATPARQYPKPKKDHAHFYFVTDKGALKTPEILEEDLGENRHPLSPLFHAMHALISDIRDLVEQ